MTAHGTRSRYNYGCRCRPCRNSNAVYGMEYRRHHGQLTEWVDREDVAEMIRRGSSERGMKNLVEDYAERYEVSFDKAWGRYGAICYKRHVRRVSLEEADRWSTLVRLAPWTAA